MPSRPRRPSSSCGDVVATGRRRRAAVAAAAAVARPCWRNAVGSYVIVCTASESALVPSGRARARCAPPHMPRQTHLRVGPEGRTRTVEPAGCGLRCLSVCVLRDVPAQPAAGTAGSMWPHDQCTACMYAVLCPAGPGGHPARAAAGSPSSMRTSFVSLPVWRNSRRWVAEPAPMNGDCRNPDGAASRRERSGAGAALRLKVYSGAGLRVSEHQSTNNTARRLGALACAGNSRPPPFCCSDRSIGGGPCPFACPQLVDAWQAHENSLSQVGPRNQRARNHPARVPQLELSASLPAKLFE